MKILEFGSVVKSLIESMSINEVIEGRIYPVIASYTKKPFIVYQRTGIDLSGNKDTLYEYGNVNIDISVMSDKYTQSVEIASKIIEEMPSYGVEIDSFDISEIKLTNAVEDFQDDVYVQVLTFNFTIN